MDRAQTERAVRALLEALGRDPDSTELAETPERVAEAFENDLLVGYDVDVPGLLAGGMGPADVSGVVIVDGISVSTTCPHHLMPALGQATVAYVPSDRVIGLGTLARVVDAYARRLTLQETIGTSVVHALCEHAGAVGALCRISLSHTCLAARGAKATNAAVVTIATAGMRLDELRLAVLGKSET